MAREVDWRNSAVHRYLILVASVLMQACLGGVYTWSTFVPALTSKYGLSTAQTQAIFGIAFCVFTGLMILAGRLQEKYGPRIIGIIAGLLLGTGYIISSQSGGSFTLLFIGYGLVGGAGIGFGYVCPLATCVKWFPEHKGLITGIVVAGFGSGAILFSSMAGGLLDRGVDVLEVFRLMGIASGLTVMGCALLLTVPENSGQQSMPTEFPLRWLIRQGSFKLSAIGMFSGTFAGMMIIGNINPIGLSAGLAPGFAGIAVSTFAVGNTIGRVLWGRISDKIGRAAIPMSLLYMTIAVILLIPAGNSAMSFVLAAMAVGFGFGACFVIYAAEVTSEYGARAIGNVYPTIMLFYGVSGLAGPGIGGWLFDTTGAYTLSGVIAASVTATGCLLTGFLARRHRSPFCFSHGCDWKSHASGVRYEEQERETADCA